MLTKEQVDRIRTLKGKGYTINQIATEMGFHYNTVKKYFDDRKDYKDFRSQANLGRPSSFHKFEKEIIDILKMNPYSSAAKIHRELVDKYGESYPYSIRTTSRHILKIRKEQGLEKKK